MFKIFSKIGCKIDPFFIYFITTKLSNLHSPHLFFFRTWLNSHFKKGLAFFFSRQAGSDTVEMVGHRNHNRLLMITIYSLGALPRPRASPVGSPPPLPPPTLPPSPSQSHLPDFCWMAVPTLPGWAGPGADSTLCGGGHGSCQKHCWNILGAPPIPVVRLFNTHQLDAGRRRIFFKPTTLSQTGPPLPQQSSAPAHGAPAGRHGSRPFLHPNPGIPCTSIGTPRIKGLFGVWLVCMMNSDLILIVISFFCSLCIF